MKNASVTLSRIYRLVCKMLHFIAIFSLIRQAWTFNWPAPTYPSANEFSVDGWTPKPTPQVGLLEKRQDFNPTICGYVGGIASK